MRASSIQRKLRDLNVPIEKARSAAERYGDDAGTPTDMEKLQKAIRKAARQKLVEQHRREFRTWCKANGIPNPTHEYKISTARNWRADWAWVHPDGGGVLLEIDGGGWKLGRHHRPAGFREDQAKRNAAIALGFLPLHCTPETLYTDETASAIRAAIHQQGDIR